MNNQNQKTILQEVKKLRLSASKILKIKFVNKLVELIQKYKTNNKILQKRLEQNEKMSNVAKYKFTKRLLNNAKHPMFETLKEKAEKKLTNKIQDIEEDNKKTQKELDTNTKKLTKWTTTINQVESNDLKFSRQNINKEVKEILNCL